MRFRHGHFVAGSLAGILLIPALSHAESGTPELIGSFLTAYAKSEFGDIAVAVIGAALAGVGQLWSVQAQRERERELLFIGEQYRVALARYVAATPPGKARHPLTLEDLVEDRRHIVIRRHLRQVYPDPFTNAADWEAVRAPDGGMPPCTAATTARR